jgi:hypothetical protein
MAGEVAVTEAGESATVPVDIPSGLRVERTGSGGWRFELPPAEVAWYRDLFAFLVMAACFGILAYLASREFWPRPPAWVEEAAAERASLYFGLANASIWVAIFLVRLGTVLFQRLGRRDILVEKGTFSKGFRLPIVGRFSTGTFKLSDFADMVVISQRVRNRATHYLDLSFVWHHQRVGKGLKRPVLEWLGWRIAELTDEHFASRATTRSMLARFAASEVLHRLGSGETASADLIAKTRGCQLEPTSGMEIQEQSGGFLRLRLAGKPDRGPAMMLFAAFCIFLMVPFWAISHLPEVRKWDAPELLGAGVAGGLLVCALGMAAFAAKRRLKSEELEVRVGEVYWRARSLLGITSATIGGLRLELSREVEFNGLDEPITSLVVTAESGRRIKFARNRPAAEHLWIMRQVVGVLGQDCLPQKIV